MIIVGSQALVRQLGKVRTPKDIDMFGTQQEGFNFMNSALNQNVERVDISFKNKVILFGDKKAIIEVELTDHPLNKQIHDEMKRASFDGLHANLNWLYFLKMSHRYKKDTKHFLKTMQDILLLRTAAILPAQYSLFEQREKETYDYGHPKLNVKKDDFFNKEESFYIYDHDDLHRVVAVKDKPAYTLYMVDGEEVKSSREKFDSLNDLDKLLGVLEESYVLALERCLIPNNFKVSPKVAFDMALEKVCTSITSGWFREYAWENYFRVQSLYDSSFVQKFKQNEPNIKKFNGSKY